MEEGRTRTGLVVQVRAPGAFAAGKGTKQRYWKDPSDATLRKWDRFLNARIIKGNNFDFLEIV